MPPTPSAQPNPQPYCDDFVKTSAPTLPPTGVVRVYADSTTGLFTAIDSSGNDAISGVANAVTAASTLTANALTLGGGSKTVSALASLGTATTVLHGNAAGAPTFAAISAADLPGGINSVTTLVSAANLALIPATPFQILPAPAAGTLIVPITATFDYKFLTTAYTLGNSDNVLVLVGHGKTVPIISAAAVGLVDQTANTFVIKQAVTTNQVRANFAALGLDLVIQGTAPLLTLGLGSLTITVVYTTVTLA